MADPLGEATCRSVERIFDAVPFNKSDRKRLQFEDKKLNHFFENGILNYSLVEVVGPSGSGKTQFALTLCADILLKIIQQERQAIVLYVYFNRMFPIGRLEEIIRGKLELRQRRIQGDTEDNVSSFKGAHGRDEAYYCFQGGNEKRTEQIEGSGQVGNHDQTHRDEAGRTDTNHAQNCPVRKALENLYIQKINEEKEFFQLIKKDIQYILKHHQISLLVIDSLNSLFNGNDKLEVYKKCQIFTSISQSLKQLAYENNFFLLVLNSWHPRKDYIHFSFNLFDYVINSSFSNTIIYFKKRKRKNKIDRRMIIKFSEFLRKYKSMRFEINDSGFSLP
ncbi:conserved Plasmodium protein, unknown function [Plasmodium knowlesi strain H]|uniref:Uncharacterized protein n=3 Tax=Plasmodium knowlesi TaxID=5850 RepID=A0A5K1U106_PLAKH|nr:conserved Plasmodium protein, unknown function [Plasmodium knowlesi strain H]OTN67945.1 Uncharacterized protein PKNOH_S04364600 [Plasmodium knowlesi]CAA9987006.1 conserved Plasmodium protein, unknown function [Plasmodium knowlesi strain H]SBO26665.1 conserved Plasmodium protein, unknown function [Plasmodium knowlesi strain H]SBO28211.1 conserved Plasmodium protein, unknown function [Plasmodium knowlesi strain H]VVS76480.1 conserved Plasmodium protein, unknown function [Plasmodium knowlesi s|eukprot:XP_002258251.1 hypothetical protein, conserved in Plasmodium species [Plasmodium knowlesi strain H]